MRRVAVLGCCVLVGMLLWGLAAAQASVGVGVNIGQIKLDQPLRPGQIYSLPPITVSNSGDQAGQYELGVSYHADQKERRPPAAWFNFNPESFDLDPGKSRKVAIGLTVPVNVRPGDYFAFLEAHPKRGPGAVSIGVAAATKLSFTIKPANLWSAIVNRIRGWIETTAPASYVVIGVLALTGVALLFSRFFSLRLGVERKVRDKS